MKAIVAALVIAATAAIGQDVNITPPDNGFVHFYATPKELARDLRITQSGKPVMEFRADGSIWVHGKKVEDDKEVVEAMRQFLRGECSKTAAR